MRINVQDVNAAQKRIEITVPAKVITEQLEAGFRDAMRNARIRGFRPGKVPRNLVERHYGDIVRGQVTASLMEENTKKALEQEKITPVAPPVMEPGKLEPGKDFYFVANVEVLPLVELKEYKGIEVVVERAKAEVTDTDVERAAEELRKRNAALKKPEPARLAQKGDVLILDMKADAKGVSISHEENFAVEIGAGMMPEEFENALIGLNVGDRKEVTVAYPPDDSHALSGQEVHFDFTVKDVQEKILPALDEEFAKDMGRESLDDLKSHLRSRLLETRQDLINRRAKDEILKNLRERHPLDLPPTILARQHKSLEEEIKKQFASSGLPYMEEQFGKEISKKAREKVHDDLLIKAIAEKENIKPTEEQIEGQVRKLAEARGQNIEKFKDMLSAQRGMDAIRYQLRDSMTLDFLLQNAILKEGAPAEKTANKTQDAPQKKKTAPKHKKQDK